MHADHRKHSGHNQHAGHSVAMFRDKFWLSLALALPVVFWSDDVQHWLGYHAPTFPGSQIIPAILGTIVFVYGGRVFIQCALRELSDRQPGMMVTSLFPSSLTVSFAWAATVAETLFGILLIAGFKIRMASVLSGLLLLSFAIGMATGLGIKTPFDYSVFSAAAAAFLLAFWEPDRFTLDKLLNRLRN